MRKAWQRDSSSRKRQAEAWLDVPRLSKAPLKHFPNPRIISAVKASAARFAILILASVFASGQANSYPKSQIPSAVGQVAPDFTLKDQDGKDFKLSDQRGHWVLLFFYRGYW